MIKHDKTWHVFSEAISGSSDFVGSFFGSDVLRPKRESVCFKSESSEAYINQMTRQKKVKQKSRNK